MAPTTRPTTATAR